MQGSVNGLTGDWLIHLYCQISWVFIQEITIFWEKSWNHDQPVNPVPIKVNG